MMNDLESALFVFNKNDNKTFNQIYWQSVRAESELELARIDLLKAKRNTDRIDTIIQSFKAIRSAMEDYKNKYTQLIQRFYEDRIEYEKKIAELQNEINILKFDEL